MGNPFTRFFDRIRGSGEAAITLPPMDGALRPNNRIEEADVIFETSSPDNLVRSGSGISFSSGAVLMSLEKDGKTKALWNASSHITCLAGHSSGTLAAGLEEGRIVIRGGPHDGLSLDRFEDTPVKAPSAAVFADEKTLYVCLASQDNPMSQWKRDLMSKGNSGSVWKVDLRTGKAVCLGRNLAFPYGIVLAENGDVIVSESWRHQVIRISEGGGIQTLLDELPGYPSRLVRDANQDIWMCVFAPRTQLIEFVLSEKEYRTRMMETVDPEYWIAPSLHHPHSYLEPMQGGGLKQLGELKPWAPTRSIGLVARLDPQGHPIESFHSRANGKRHGIASCLPSDDGLIMASIGGNVIVRAKN